MTTTSAAFQIGVRHPVHPKRLARFRELAGLTQQNLADELDVTQVTVARWETGKRTPNVAMVQRLVAVCLERPTNSLLCLERGRRWAQAWAAAHLGGGETLLRADDWIRLLQFPKKWLKGVPRERMGRNTYIRGDWVGLVLEDAVHGNRRFSIALLSTHMDTVMQHAALHQIGEGRLVMELEQALCRETVQHLIEMSAQQAIRKDADDER